MHQVQRTNVEGTFHFAGNFSRCAKDVREIQCSVNEETLGEIRFDFIKGEPQRLPVNLATQFQAPQGTVQFKSAKR